MRMKHKTAVVTVFFVGVFPAKEKEYDLKTCQPHIKSYYYFNICFNLSPNFNYKDGRPLLEAQCAVSGGGHLGNGCPNFFLAKMELQSPLACFAPDYMCFFLPYTICLLRCLSYVCPTQPQIKPCCYFNVCLSFS